MSSRPASASIVRRRGGRRLAFTLSTVIAGFVAITTACSNQGEGERCEVANRNEDCATDQGLICYPANQLATTSDRCCPADRSKATNPICKAAVTIAIDAATPADTGPSPTVDSGSLTDASDASEPDADAGEADASDASDAADQ